MEFAHIPVMLNECIDSLCIKPDGIYMDATVGGGGHSKEIAKRLGESGRLIDFDKDAEALIAAGENLKEYSSKITFVHDDFKNFGEELDKLNIDKLDGILVDLGVSSYQLDCEERGFSYMKDAPLDMRMDREQYLTAFNVVNEYSVSELVRILRDYGEEKLAVRIAERIASAREKQTISTTKQLAELVEGCYPTATRWKFGNPAKRTFQAVRIEVNGELVRLYDALKNMALRLKEGGRMAVISFHSLEDRIVKNVFRDLAIECTCPPDFPICVCGHHADVKNVTKKPLVASEEELKINKRAESAKLRVVERI